MRRRGTVIGSYLCIVVLVTIAGVFGDEQSSTVRKHPNVGHGPTVVSSSIYVIDIDDIDAAAQNFTANVFITMKWKDPRLAGETEDIRTFKIADVWTPNILVVNKQRLWKSLPDVVEVEPDGSVRYMQRCSGMLSQPLNLSEFPMDQHTFQIRLAAAGHEADEVVFVSNKERPGGIAEKLSVADWNIENWNIKAGTWEAAPGVKIPVIDYNFEAKRYLGYYIWKIMLPLILIVMMSWAVFWIDPTFSGAQIGVATTSMLTLIAYRFLLGNYLPRISYMTRLDYFITGNTALVFFALVEVLITSALARKKREILSRRFDFWSRFLFPAAFIAILIYSFYY